MRTRRRVSHSAQLPFDFDTPAPPRRGAGRLAATLERHAQIEGALRTRGPNPYPDEIEDEGWSRQLPAFHFVGPLEATLLQDAEAAAEALTEMLPEQEDDYPAGLVDPTLAACVLIYAESLADLTDEELWADLLTTQRAGREDTAALIAAELSRCEPESLDRFPFAPRPAPQQFSAKAYHRLT